MKIRLVLAALLSAASSLYAQTSAFTYQGNLNDNGGPANGQYDIAFTLFSSASGPTQVGSPLAGLAIPVTNGLFNVTLNFGDQFPGADRWLEISVRTNGGGLFTTLSPRQPIRPTPYATYSVTAGSANSVAATNVSGTIPLTQLPATLVTNNATGVNISGTFTGNGTGLTDLNAANLTGPVPSTSLTSVPAGNLTGSVSDARLSTNVALRIGGNTFSGRQQVVDAVATAPQALDQQQTITDTGGINLIRPWQSFTAGANGLLTAVALHVNSPLFVGNSPGTINIYAGEGTNGVLLATHPVTWISNQFGTLQTNTLISPPQLQAGTQYTIQIDAPVIQKGWVYVNQAGGYAAGRFSVDANWDCLFKTFMSPGATGQTVLMVNPPGFSGNVGIGTNAPQAKLHVLGNILATGTVTGNGAGLTNVNAASGAGNFSGTFTGNSSGTISGNGNGLTNLSATSLASGAVADARLSGNVALLNRAIQPFTGGTNSFSGNVGIGTTTPQARLQVAGDIKLGSSGQYFAPSGEENLRIVRGSISAAGAIVNGAGFSASRTSTANYQITFGTAFSSTPTIVVSCGSATGQALGALDVAVSYNASTTNFNVQTGVRSFGFFDEPFSFIAVGPR